MRNIMIHDRLPGQLVDLSLYIAPSPGLFRSCLIEF